MSWRDTSPDPSDGFDRLAHHRAIAAWNIARQAFEELPRDVHVRLVLEAIDRLPRPATRTEITAMIAGRLPEFYVDSELVHRVLVRLLDAGEVDRETGRWGTCRYRWLRRVPDAVADLERAFVEVS